MTYGRLIYLYNLYGAYHSAFSIFRFNNKGREETRQDSERTICLPESIVTTTEDLTPPKQQSVLLPQGGGELLEFEVPGNTSRMAKEFTKARRIPKQWQQ